jgi:hypothetical protein
MNPEKTKYKGDSKYTHFLNFVVLSALLIVSTVTSMDTLHCEAVPTLNTQLC